MIIPSIDLMNGKAVQLKQGKEKALEKDNPIELARRFGLYGEVAVIDLDSALGTGDNVELIKSICRVADCRVGGGIRTIEKAKELLGAGAKKVIIGTKATPDFLKKLPKNKVIVAVDTKNGFVVTEGWRKETKQKPEELIKELEPYCSGFLFTNVDKEGLLEGTDEEKINNLSGLTENKITIAGGITTIEEIKAIEKLGFNSQLGMSIYTGKIGLSKAFAELLDFEKNNGLIPTVIQDGRNQVLMLAYSTKESLKQAFEEAKGTYWSRSRKKIWSKGDTSGNSQKLIKVRYDCDRDTLLFTVKQENAACHFGNYSCFGDKEFSIKDVFEVIESRVKCPSEDSYTSKVSEKEGDIKAKILEEAQEVTNYKDKENLVWEIADLAYFTMVLMAKNGISVEQVKNELRGREK
jgi:phosphoribosylformimino-5-aminoimidazole carboxamide ribotide isomerase